MKTKISLDLKELAPPLLAILFSFIIYNNWVQFWFTFMEEPIRVLLVLSSLIFISWFILKNVFKRF